MTDHPAKFPTPSTWKNLFRRLTGLFRSLVYLLGIAWAAGAVYYCTPIDSSLGRAILAVVYLVLAVVFILGLVTPLRRFAGWLLTMAVVVVPWLTLQPSNEGEWRTEWSRLPYAERDGEAFTFHHFRNFDRPLDGEQFTPRWETRTVHLSNLKGLDYFHHDFTDGGLLAHPVLSFDFGEDGHVAFSVEVRYAKGQKFSPFRGLYRQYTLIYLVGDERDFIRDRANVRDEPVRLYRSSYSLDRVREMFLETVQAMNKLKDHPKFYHTVTANCTTSYLTQAPPEKRARLNYRILFNGRIESLLYERRVIVTDGLPFEELVQRATINEAARRAHHDPNFSSKIREGRPGF